MLEFRLPWPDKKLSPNHRGNWRSREEERKAAKNEGYFSAVGTDASHLQGQPLKATMLLRPADNRRRDYDNVVAAMKPTVDGIFQALRIDDSQIRMAQQVFLKPVKDKPAEVILRLEIYTGGVE